MSYDPRNELPWCAAKRNTPSRRPYTDQELAELRVLVDPMNTSIPSAQATVIWTLLDMLEEARGWTL